MSIITEAHKAVQEAMAMEQLSPNNQNKGGKKWVLGVAFVVSAMEFIGVVIFRFLTCR